MHMVDWKIAAGAAVTAMVLSLIAGFVGSVPFFTLIVRAVMSALLFGAFGAGAGYLLHTNLPELFETSHSLGKQEQEEDLVLHENGSDRYEEEHNAGGRSRGGEVDIVVDDETDEAGSRDYNQSAQEDDGGPDSGFVEEVSENSDDYGSGEEKTLDSVQDLSQVDDVDVLPDLEGFDGSFQGSPGSSAIGDVDDFPGNDGGKNSPSSDVVDIMGQQESPAVVAGAIRTVMKRDQQG